MHPRPFSAIFGKELIQTTGEGKLVKIEDNIRRQLFFQAEVAYPEECCGMLLGTMIDGVRIVREVIPIPNAQGTDRDRRFIIPPDQYRHADRIAREKNFEILGFYHSHPDHPAIPSQYDLEQALPVLISLIVEVVGGRSSTLKAWLLSEHRSRYDEELITVGG